MKSRSRIPGSARLFAFAALFIAGLAAAPDIPTVAESAGLAGFET
jgi:hypothetical protein